MLALFFLPLLVLQVSAQHGFKPSITCYMKYDHKETKSQNSNALLGYSYHQSEITQYTTTEGEPCSKVGCACFSYRSVCSYSTPGANHYSSCTDADRNGGVVQWHRGWASHEQCEQMRRHPQTYLDLTCCYTDRCNDQPGKIIKVVDSQLPVPQYLPYAHQALDTVPTAPRSSQRYITHVHHPSTSRAPEAYKSSTTYASALLLSNSLSLNSLSNWLILLALAFCLLIVV